MGEVQPNATIFLPPTHQMFLFYWKILLLITAILSGNHLAKQATHLCIGPSAVLHKGRAVQVFKRGNWGLGKLIIHDLTTNKNQNLEQNTGLLIHALEPSPEACCFPYVQDDEHRTDMQVRDISLPNSSVWSPLFFPMASTTGISRHSVLFSLACYTLYDYIAVPIRSGSRHASSESPHRAPCFREHLAHARICFLLQTKCIYFFLSEMSENQKIRRKKYPGVNLLKKKKKLRWFSISFQGVILLQFILYSEFSNVIPAHNVSSTALGNTQAWALNFILFTLFSSICHFLGAVLFWCSFQ